MFYTDNPLSDFHRYDAEREAEHQAYIESLPRCEYCRRPIDEDTCFEVSDEYYHEDCFAEHHRKRVEDIVT